MTDLAHWNVAMDFSGQEAAALAVGVDPLTDGVVKGYPLLERMKSSYNAKKRWHEENGGPPQCDELDHALTADQMLESCEMHCLDVREDLEESGDLLCWIQDEQKSDFKSQRFSRKELARWLSEVGVVSVYPFGKQSPQAGIDKPLGTKERLSMLKLIFGMAKAYYKYDPANKSAAAKQIMNDLIAVSISLDEDTILKYLKQGEDCISTGQTLNP